MSGDATAVANPLGLGYYVMSVPNAPSDGILCSYTDSAGNKVLEVRRATSPTSEYSLVDGENRALGVFRPKPLGFVLGFGLYNKQMALIGSAVATPAFAGSKQDFVLEDPDGKEIAFALAIDRFGSNYSITSADRTGAIAELRLMDPGGASNPGPLSAKRVFNFAKGPPHSLEIIDAKFPTILLIGLTSFMAHQNSVLFYGL